MIPDYAEITCETCGIVPLTEDQYFHQVQNCPDLEWFCPRCKAVVPDCVLLGELWR